MLIFLVHLESVAQIPPFGSVLKLRVTVEHRVVLILHAITQRLGELQVELVLFLAKFYVEKMRPVHAQWHITLIFVKGTANRYLVGIYKAVST